MKSWYTSRTIHGLAASALALLIGFVVPESDVAVLSERVTEWVLNGVEIGGLVYAARGRKLASGPLTS